MAIEHISESTPTKLSSPGENNGFTRREITRLVTAVIAALAACGGPPPKPAPLDRCETEVIKEKRPPEVNFISFKLEGNTVRVEFEVKEFDVKCQGPVTVHVMGRGINHQTRASETRSLGEKSISDPRKDILTVTIPPDFRNLTELWLMVTTRTGEQRNFPAKPAI